MSEKNISTSKDSIDTSYLKEQSDRDFFSRLLRLLINGTLIILINGTLIILGLLIAIILIERELLAPSAVELLSLTSGPIIIVWLIVWLIFILWIIRWIIRMIVVAYRNVSIVAPQVIIDTPYLKEESDRDFFSRLRRLFIKWTLIMSLFGLSPIPIAIFMTLFGDRGSAMAVSWLLYITALPTIIVWLIFILWIIIMIVVRYFRKLWR